MSRPLAPDGPRPPGPPSGEPGAAPLVCPLPEPPVAFDRLTPAFCHALETAGCPVAAAILGRLRFESLLTELSARFVNIPPAQVDAHIEAGLRLLVESLGFDRSGLGQVSDDGRQFVVTHSYQLPGVPPSTRLILHEQFPTYCGMLLRGEVVRLPDDLPPEATPERDYMRRTGLKSNVSIPLTVTGAVVGGLGLASFRLNRVLPDEIIPRLRLVGDIFANALARKQADEALRAKEQSLRDSEQHLSRLAARLLRAQEEERRRIARELHDDWSQRLAVLGLDLAGLENDLPPESAGRRSLRRAQDDLVGLSEDVRDVSHQLHPAILEDLGLVEALRAECAGFSRRTGIAAGYRTSGVPPDLPADVALCVYRVAQEGLRNLARHAGVREARVELRGGRAELHLQVRDRGAGFDPGAARASPGLGLSSMAERARLVGGRLAVRSAPGRGTTLELRVPLEARPS